jgi:hypothetical protein
MTRAEVKAIAAEVAQLLAPMLASMLPALQQVTPASRLDPDRVRHEDSCLLDAKRTMSEADYVVYHADIMAGRAETLGQYSSAVRIRKLARAKAAKLAMREA